MVDDKDMALPAEPDRAVVNGAASVSALRASVPSALIAGLAVFAAYAGGYMRGQSAGFDRARDAIMCVGLATTGDVDRGNRRYCNTLGIDFSRLQAQAIETRRAETEGLGAQHESAVPAGDAPKGGPHD